MTHTLRPFACAWLLALPLLLVGVPLAAIAQNRSKPPSDPTTDPAMIAAGFLSSHPDLRFRLAGLEQFKKGEYKDALSSFQRAAYYADKPAQGMVAEMLWSGQGAAQDRVLAYAWMDLAAERGYAVFVDMRERYWGAMTKDERLRVAAEGEAVYARYGDVVAQPRLATVLRRGSRNVTGSRTGAVGSLTIIIPGPGGDIESEGSSIDGSTFYNPKYWDPKQYYAWHDSIWMKPPRMGHVNVGDVEKVESDKAVPVPVPEVKKP